MNNTINDIFFDPPCPSGRLKIDYVLAQPQDRCTIGCDKADKIRSKFDINRSNPLENVTGSASYFFHSLNKCHFCGIRQRYNGIKPGSVRASITVNFRDCPTFSIKNGCEMC